MPYVCAPETVTPEMVRSPTASMAKMLKSRFVTPLLPLMISEEAPGPVMVTVPAVPPPLPIIDVLALTMLGSEEPRVMVPVTLKLMMSSPAVMLARSIAARRDPVPESAVVETKMGEFEGVILSSNLSSSNLGEPEALRTFRFWELPKSLRKAFKSIEVFPIQKN